MLHVTISYMLSREDIVEGTYLKQITERYGNPRGAVAVVDRVSAQLAGEWAFQLRYLNLPKECKTEVRPLRSFDFGEEDLVHFERISEACVLAPNPLSTKPRNKRWLPGMKRKRYPKQLPLFKGF